MWSPVSWHWNRGSEMMVTSDAIPGRKQAAQNKNVQPSVETVEKLSCFSVYLFCQILKSQLNQIWSSFSGNHAIYPQKFTYCHNSQV